MNQSWLTFWYTIMLILRLVMSIVQINCIPGRGLAKPSSLQAWNQTNWPGNWNEKKRKRKDLLEREKCERMRINCLVSQYYQYYRLFFFMAYFLRSHWKRYSQTFCYSNCITTISVILQNAAFDLEWPTNSLQHGLRLVQNGPISWWRTWDMMMLYINMYISIFI